MDENQSPEHEQPQIQKGSGWREKFMTVTPLSKYLAMILFVALPFFGFWLGLRFQIPQTTQVQLEDNVTLPLSEGKVSETKGSLDNWQHGAYFGFHYQYPADWKRIFADNAVSTQVSHFVGDGKSIRINDTSVFCLVDNQSECWYGEIVVTNEDNVLRNGEESAEILAYQLAKYNQDDTYISKEITISGYDNNILIYTSIENGTIIIPLLIPTINSRSIYVEIILQNLSDAEIKKILNSFHKIEKHWTLKRAEV